MISKCINKVFIVIFFSAGLLACEKFEGEQTIPAYIHVDTIFLESNPLLEEGYLTHNYTDIWVFVDDQMIGAFELPATIPILASGKHRLELYAGVIYNGISGTRGQYLFTRPRVYQEIDLVIDSVITRDPTVSYYDNTQFLWVEDFEGTLSLNPTPNSDTILYKSYHDPASQFYGLSSGVGYLDSEHVLFEVSTFSSESPGFGFPSGGQPVFLEMDYNTNNLMSVGMFITQIGSGITQHPILILNSTEGKWKKVYINLSPSVSAYNTSDFFNIYLRADKESTVDNPVILMDNLKLIYRVAY